MKVAVSKKSQKKRRWPFVLLLVIAVLVLPIAALFIFVYDANTKQLNIPENETVENISNNITVDSLDSAPTDHKLNFVVTEKDMDAIIDCALRDAGAKGGVVKKAYVYVHENRSELNSTLFSKRPVTKCHSSSPLETSPLDVSVDLKISPQASSVPSLTLLPSTPLLRRLD